MCRRVAASLETLAKPKIRHFDSSNSAPGTHKHAHTHTRTDRLDTEPKRPNALLRSVGWLGVVYRSTASDEQLRMAAVPSVLWHIRFGGLAYVRQLCRLITKNVYVLMSCRHVGQPKWIARVRVHCELSILSALVRFPWPIEYIKLAAWMTTMTDASCSAR